MKNETECQHLTGKIYDYKSYPGTREDPPEETGRVECDGCGEAFELGYQPHGMELEIVEYR